MAAAVRNGLYNEHLERESRSDSSESVTMSTGAKAPVAGTSCLLAPQYSVGLSSFDSIH
jgi:hypothetical protein